MALKLNIPLCDLAWFDTSPDVGDPNCICSYCGFVIREDDDLIRFWRRGDDYVPKADKPGFLVPVAKGPKNLYEDKDGKWGQWFREKSDLTEARLHSWCLQLLTN